MNDTILAPLVLFVYNRPEHTRRTVEALRANRLAPRSRLFVFSDGPKNDEARPKVEAVRRYVGSISGFDSVEIVEQEANQGLAASVISGVTQVVEEYGKVIVLEDDLLTSPYFLDYMNEGLELYKEEEEVATIHAHVFPLELPSLPQSFFLPSTGGWGWATWQRAWKDFEHDGKVLLKQIKEKNLSYQFDFNGAYPYTELLELQTLGKVSSWAVRWYATNFLLKRKGLFPSLSFAVNLGFDNSGVHCKTADLSRMNACLEENYMRLQKIPICVDETIVKAYQNAVRLSAKKTFFQRLESWNLKRVKRIFVKC